MFESGAGVWGGSAWLALFAAGGVKTLTPTLSHPRWWCVLQMRFLARAGEGEGAQSSGAGSAGFEELVDGFDELVGLDGFAEVALEAGGEGFGAVGVAGVGGERDGGGRRCGVRGGGNRFEGADLAHELVAVEHGEADVADEDVGS